MSNSAVDVQVSAEAASRNRLSAIVDRYRRFTVAYMREARSLGDFWRLMKVRLAQSKIGKLVCPQPIVAAVKLQSFGPSPINVRSHTTDISVLGEIIVSGGYDALLRHPPAKVEYAIDLGANVGLVDRWLLERYPGVEIVAVEPEPGNAHILRENVKGFPVAVVQAAVGGSARKMQLHTSSGEHGFTIVGKPQAGEPVHEVDVVTFDTVAAKDRHIDLLKVDIEGAEEELFADCSGWIDRVGTLLVECHGDYKLSSLLADLSRAGAEFEVIEADMKPQWDFEVGLLTRKAAH